MGFNFENAELLKRKIRDEMYYRGYPNDVDDAYQLYMLKKIESDSFNQSIRFFCADYIRGQYTGRNRKHYKGEVFFTAQEMETIQADDGAEKIENEIEFKL